MYILLATHGTGKTTLLESLKNKLPGFYMTDGFSRPVKKIKHLLELNQFNEQIIINEMTCWAFENYIPQNVISTRSPIDAMIYTQYYCPGKLQESLERLKAAFEKDKDKIKGIFYIPIEFEIEDDGVRFIDNKDQKGIDDLMLKFISDNKLKVVTVKGSIEERVKIVLETIKRTH